MIKTESRVRDLWRGKGRANRAKRDYEGQTGMDRELECKG